MPRPFALFAAVAVLAACAADSTNILDELYADAEDDTDGSGDAGGSGDVGGDVLAGPDFLDPCEDADGCASGYCLPDEGGRVCTQLCVDGACPGDFLCRHLRLSSTESIRLCVPPRDTLCGSCTSDLDCGGFGDMCVVLDDELGHCARDCGADPSCPPGYFCQDATSVGGAEGRQCLPTSGVCSCPSDQFGDTRECLRASGGWVCSGEEVCDASAGWSGCTAEGPVGEICDGLDNNCDGDVDEGLEPRTCTSPPNPAGVCEGTEVCTGAGGWVCDAPLAAIETCDGQDNDCNGSVDDGLCFDGNPCTVDSCRSDGGCDFDPFEGPCDDGDACTVEEVCAAGICSGSPRDCDDDNPCTVDTCDSDTGCVHTPDDGLGCDTGNQCEVGRCDETGACVAAGSVTCGTPDPCVRHWCDEVAGCQSEPLTGVRCDDGDGCSTNDVCESGVCRPGGPYCAGRPCDNCEGNWGSGGTCDASGFLGPQCICPCG